MKSVATALGQYRTTLTPTRPGPGLRSLCFGRFCLVTSTETLTKLHMPRWQKGCYNLVVLLHFVWNFGISSCMIHTVAIRPVHYRYTIGHGGHVCRCRIQCKWVPNKAGTRKFQKSSHADKGMIHWPPRHQFHGTKTGFGITVVKIGYS